MKKKPSNFFALLDKKIAETTAIKAEEVRQYALDREERRAAELAAEQQVIADKEAAVKAYQDYLDRPRTAERPTHQHHARSSFSSVNSRDLDD